MFFHQWFLDGIHCVVRHQSLDNWTLFRRKYCHKANILPTIIVWKWHNHWGRMAAISQTTFWNVFSWMTMFKFRLIFHWSLFLRVIMAKWIMAWLRWRAIEWCAVTYFFLEREIHRTMNVLWFVNTLRPRQNGRHFADDTFKRIFINENVKFSINISMKFVPKGLINNIPALVQIMAWRRPGDKPLFEPMMVNLSTQICVTRPQWVKENRKRLHFFFMIYLFFAIL